MLTLKGVWSIVTTSTTQRDNEMMTTAEQNDLLKANNFTQDQREEAVTFMLSIAPMFNSGFLKYYSNVGWDIPETF